MDNGAKWSLVTSADVIVNDVLIDPRNPERVLVATDLRGILASNDGFAHYTTSNSGFSHRVVTEVVVDRKDPSHIYAGVANDSEMGGVFVSDDSGKTWRQNSKGLDGRDVLSLQQSDGSELFAGTNHGIYSSSAKNIWEPASMIVGILPEWRPKPTEPEPAPVKPKPSKSKPTHATAAHSKVAAKAKPPLEPVIPAATAPRVRSLQIGKDIWFAATNEGLFMSSDQGKKWYGELIEGENNFTGVNSYDDGTVTLVSHKAAYISHDGGKTWATLTLPTYVGQINSLTLTPDSSLWLTSRQGAVQSTDGGKTWRYVMGGLPKDDVLVVEYDAAGQRLLATALQEHEVFMSKDNGLTWQHTDSAGVPIRSAISYQGHLLATSAYNGMLLQEDNGQSASNPTNSAAIAELGKGSQ